MTATGQQGERRALTLEDGVVLNIWHADGRYMRDFFYAQTYILEWAKRPSVVRYLRQ